MALLYYHHYMTICKKENKTKEIQSLCKTSCITIQQRQIMRFNIQTQTKLLVDGNEIQLDRLVYLDTIISTDSTQKDIKNRLSKSRTTWHKL
jgi:hypothetical protein